VQRMRRDELPVRVVLRALRRGADRRLSRARADYRPALAIALF
jgi:hypothetical protein